MFFSSLLFALAITWVTAVADAVVESARTAATQIVLFGRVLYTPVDSRQGVWIVCALSASASLVVVTAAASARGRRLKRRVAEELGRIEQSKMREIGDAALAQLLPNRIAELQTSVDTLTTQRDQVLAELREARTRQNQKADALNAVVRVPEGSEAPTVVLAEADEPSRTA